MAPVNWWPLLLVAFVLSVLFRVYTLSAVIVMLAAVSGVAEWWKRRSLEQVIYKRNFIYTRGFPGERLDALIEVENRKFLPIPWLRVQDRMPILVGPEDERQIIRAESEQMGAVVSLFSLRWYERDRRLLRLLLRSRGVYRLGPVSLESGDMFGLFEQAGELENYDYLTVYPQPLAFEALQFPVGDPFGDRRTQRRLYEDPNQPLGVRSYHPEDDFRRIHWPATAHTGELQVRVFQPVSARMLVVCMNISTLAHYWEGTLPDVLDYLVRAAASICERGLQDGYRVGLISNGHLGYSDQPFRVPPGCSPAQLTRLLTMLASVTPFTVAPFDRFLMSEAPRLPYGATLVVVTSILPPELVETLARLGRYARRITLLSFTQRKPPEIPGVQIIHHPLMGAER